LALLFAVFLLPLLFASPAVGVGIVGNDKESIASVARPDGCRADAIPFRIVPARGQVSEYGSEPPRSKSWDVFHDDESGSNLANDPVHFPPKAGPLPSQTGSTSCQADVLARESSADDVGISEIVSSNCFDVIESLRFRPVLCKYVPAKIILLNLPDCFADARNLETYLESTDAREKTTYRKHEMPHLLSK
jgi:hypothetical protein